jgi:hypothetical protein
MLENLRETKHGEEMIYLKMRNVIIYNSPSADPKRTLTELRPSVIFVGSPFTYRTLIERAERASELLCNADADTQLLTTTRLFHRRKNNRPGVISPFRQVIGRLSEPFNLYHLKTLNDLSPP